MIDTITLITLISLNNVTDNNQQSTNSWKLFPSDFSCSISQNINTQPNSFVYISYRVDGRVAIRFHNETWSINGPKTIDPIFEFNDGSQISLPSNDSITNGRVKLRGFTAIIDKPTLAKIASNDTITIKYISDTSATFQTQSLKKMHDNLLNCTEKLETKNTPENKIPTTSPALLRGFSIKRSDYPKIAKKQRVEGKVRFKLTVNRKGNPIACEVTSTSGSTELDNKTCTILLKRSRFSPAKNSAGEPVSDFYRSSINWKL